MSSDNILFEYYITRLISGCTEEEIRSIIMDVYDIGRQDQKSPIKLMDVRDLYEPL